MELEVYDRYVIIWLFLYHTQYQPWTNNYANFDRFLGTVFNVYVKQIIDNFLH
jgi:hypothetical protein